MSNLLTLKLFPGFPAPVITWSKLRSPLPWGHKVVNNSLVLANVGRQDSGEYICRATNSIGSSQVTIKLHVESEFWDVGVRSRAGFKPSSETLVTQIKQMISVSSPPSLQLFRTPRCCLITWLSGSGR